MVDRHDARVRSVVSGLVLGLSFALPGAARAQFTEPPGPTAYALTNVIVVRADGTQSAGQTVVVRNGRIEAIGPAGSVRVTADARVLDGDTLYVYPGLIDAAGTVKHEFPRDTADRSQIRSWDPPRLTQGFTPSRRVVDVMQATGSDVADLRKKGIVAVAVHPPATDPLMPGRGALVMLRPGAKTPAQLLLQPELAPLMTLRGGRGVYPSTGMGVITWYRQTFLDAQRRTQLAQGPNGGADLSIEAPYDADYSVVEELLRSQGRVFFAANSADEIRRVLALAAEFRLKPVVVGGSGAWQVASELRSADVPVLVSVDFPRPRQWKPDEQAKEGEEPPALPPGAWREKKELEESYANAGRLASAGVTFALVSGGRGDLLEGARKTIEHGLSDVDALRALTATPAALLGVAPIARVEAGRPATFIVTDRPLFEKDARVLYTFVEGALERGAEARRTAAASDTTGGAASAAVDVAGTWLMEVEGQESTLRLTQDGTELKGTLESPQGSMQVSGSMDGDAITMTGTLTMGGQSIPLTFKGVVTGNEASGTVDTPMGSLGWRGRRAPGGGTQ